MTGPARAVWWQAHPRDLPPDPSAWTVIGEDAFQEKESRVTGHHLLPDRAPGWAEDLLRVARAVFLADKRVRRSGTADRWTRRIRLSVPVASPQTWGAPAVSSHLAALLETISADAWEITFRPLPVQPVEEAFPDPTRASEVALFSGGLDSLSWAATRARANDDRPLLLVQFREVSLRPLQHRVFATVKALSRGRPVGLLSMSQTPKGDGSGLRLETSSRTRGLLYAAGAIRAAAAHGAPVVHIPENGQLALNPPLTAARRAACSTRSVHPWTLHHLGALLEAVSGGGDDAVRVVNPLAHMTKGEVCRAARDAGLRPSDLEATLSCGKPPRRRHGGPRLDNCGFCFPCLVRRSGLLHANGTDHTPYELSPWIEDAPAPRTADWRALHRWLLRPFTVADLLADTPLPPGTDIGAALGVINRGREELSRLLPTARAAA